MQIIDNALSDFDAMRRYADHADFVDYENPQDGVVYPNICLDIPQAVRAEAIQMGAHALGYTPEQAIVFMRLSPAGAHAPHQAHSDEVMGRVSLMLYLNRAEDCRGGTSMVRHIATGMDCAHDALTHVKAWQEDTNNPDAWQVVEQADMQPNRALLFDAHRMHRAEPVGGFGQFQSDARLVLTGFFS